MFNTVLLVAALVLLNGAQLIEASSYYYLFATAPQPGNFGGVSAAKTLCDSAAATYGVSTASVQPLLNGSPIVSGWQPARVVVSLVNGATIAPAANFRGAAVLSINLVAAGICTAISQQVWLGLDSGFTAAADTCVASATSWNTASPSVEGKVGQCGDVNWLSGFSSCNNDRRILCVYSGSTLTPTAKPSVNPTASPSTSRPSKNPTTSRPSLNPTTSRPSLSPTTSKPTQSPVRKTLTPTTGAPVDSGGSNTDTSLLAIPIGVGVGGGVLFLIVLAVIFVTRSRQRSKREALMMNPGK